MRKWLSQFGAGLRALLLLTVILGVAYPLAITGVGQVVFHGQANGSLVDVRGKPAGDPADAVGSRLIGQDFPGDRWFHSRPSAAGDGYDALASSASQLGPSSPELKEQIARRRAAVAQQNGVPPSLVPPDALTASGSGLDPDISPAYARLQADRVAQARGLAPDAVRRLVAAHTAGRALGVLGDPVVNVLGLNTALADLDR